MIPDYNILQSLFNGWYIAPRPCRNKRYGYGMYSADDPKYPICLLTIRQFDRMKNLLKVKSGRYTINKSLVRQQHGNSDVKKLYKKLKSLKDGSSSISPETGI